ncbi:MAG: ATP-binding cassette domain-containing protein, partial [Thermomicrobiales bacterium]
MAALPAVRVTDLSVEFRRGAGWVSVVSGVSFELWRSRTLGLVGESGSGKTVTSMATMGLISGMGGRISRGSIEMNGVELLQQTERQWNRIRGRSIGIVFQQPMRSFNPAFTVGDQIAESARHHLGMTRRAAWNRSVELLDRVEIPDSARRANDYPHSYSGGMLQRAMLAMSLVCDPDVLIADEPTTALDVTVL